MTLSDFGKVMKRSAWGAFIRIREKEEWKS